MAKAWAKQFYNSRRWQTVRAQVLHRDHYTCADCYGRAEEVHHKISLDPSNSNDYNISLNPDNLISLCRGCHSKITKGYEGDVDKGYFFGDDGQITKI